MNDGDVVAYVQASAKFLALPLDDARAYAVAKHLSRTAQLARQLEDFPLALEDEICEIFSPAPFPTVMDSSDQGTP